MSIKPILFNTEMVRAILEGRKTVTRRVVKKKYENTDLEMFTNKYGTRLVERQNDAPPDEEIIMPDGRKGTRRRLVAMREVSEPYHPGDIMWVRETFSPVWMRPIRYLYKCFCPEADGLPVRWHPSIHMPKEAARLFLRVTAARVERLQEIDNAGAKAEGVTAETDNSGKMHRSLFVRLWNSTIKPADLPRYGWAASPWVWVIEFERCERPHDFLEG